MPIDLRKVVIAMSGLKTGFMALYLNFSTLPNHFRLYRRLLHPSTRASAGRPHDGRLRHVVVGGREAMVYRALRKRTRRPH